MSSQPQKTPHERGLAHLWSNRFPEAIVEFTEAIQLDPEFPNAYLGREIAYRAVGQADLAAKDGETARALGGPENSAWDRLVHQAYRRMKGDLGRATRGEFYAGLELSQRRALVLRELNTQILNGGLYQWIFNGHAAQIEDVIEAAGQIGTESAGRVVALMRELSRALEASPNLLVPSDECDEMEDGLDPVADCESRYFEVQSAFVRDVESWFDKQHGYQKASFSALVKDGAAVKVRPWWRFW